MHLASYRERGVLRRFRASGMRPWTVLGAQAAVAALAAVGGGVLLVALGFAACHVHVPDSPGGVLLAFVLSVVCFASTGILLGVLMPSARAAPGMGLTLFFAMMFLSGTDGPREVMGEALRRVGDFLPLTHVVTAMQDPWIGYGTNAAELALVAGMTVAAGLIAVRSFRWE